MVLCDSEIRAVLRHRQVIIEPPPPADSFTTSAVDLTLGKEFKRWRGFGAGVDITFDPAHPEFSYPQLAAKYLETVQPAGDGSVVLEPGGFLLGITAEKVVLPIAARLAARVEGRSTLARLGLGIHVTAPTIHAGFRGQITLEMTNQGAIPLKLRPGLRVCQLIFEQIFGTPSADMAGVFQDQSSVIGTA
jgi:dCTP deaminase